MILFSVPIVAETWQALEKSNDIAARARSFRVRQFAWLIEASSAFERTAIGTEVSACGHKSDCRSTAGEPTKASNLWLERAALVEGMQNMLHVWRHLVVRS